MLEPFVAPLDADCGTLRDKPDDWPVECALDDWSAVSGPLFADTDELLDSWPDAP